MKAGALSMVTGLALATAMTLVAAAPTQAAGFWSPSAAASPARAALFRPVVQPRRSAASRTWRPHRGQGAFAPGDRYPSNATTMRFVPDDRATRGVSEIPSPPLVGPKPVFRPDRRLATSADDGDSRQGALDYRLAGFRPMGAAPRSAGAMPGSPGGQWRAPEPPPSAMLPPGMSGMPFPSPWMVW